ncbi:MAG: ABC transporter permease [Anaerostipes sp.]|nr:ABC transporter permease [Anaerostipes sp.]
MKISVILRTALKALSANRRRTILTMIGIVIGISSVIAIISIGKGFQKKTTESLTNNSSGNVETNINFTANDITMDLSHMTIYSKEDLRLAESVKGVKKAYLPKDAASSTDNTMEITLNDEKTTVDYQLLTGDGQKTIAGRRLEAADNLMKQKVVVIGSSIAKEIAPSNEAAIGRGINLDGEVFTIVGVVKSTNNYVSMDETNIFLPKQTYKKYIVKETPKTTLALAIENDKNSSDVTRQVVSVLKKQGSMRQMGSYVFLDMGSLASGFGKILGGITYFISAVAGISLFIAGVGIMNMMYISVSERTKEIGIRRAMGAKKRDILLQFLLEGILITLLGGFIGFLFGLGFAHIIGIFIKITPVVDLTSILLTVGISVLIGLVFSVMPARSATQKDLIDIMK